MKNFEEIYIKDIEKIFSTEKRVNVFLRIGAVVMTLGCLIIFTESFYEILHGSWKDEISLGNLLDMLFIGWLFWPMSYVAIKGKGPKKWSHILIKIS